MHASSLQVADCNLLFDDITVSCNCACKYRPALPCLSLKLELIERLNSTPLNYHVSKRGSNTCTVGGFQAVRFIVLMRIYRSGRQVTAAIVSAG